MKQTHWRHGPTRFDHPPLEEFIGIVDGLFPLRAALDPEIGEEVILYLRDQTPFMDQLCLVRPFRLMLKAGVARNEFGPLCFLVFWIPFPADPDEPFGVYEAYLNPHSDVQTSLWGDLAAQSHWHLFLIGAGGQQRDFFEFENSFNLGQTLDLVREACGSVQFVDFDRAKAKFMQEHSVDDLLKLNEGDVF